MSYSINGSTRRDKKAAAITVLINLVLLLIDMLSASKVNIPTARVTEGDKPERIAKHHKIKTIKVKLKARPNGKRLRGRNNHFKNSKMMPICKPEIAKT